METLKEPIKQILSIDSKKLRREGKDYQFTDVSSLIDKIFEFIKKLKDSAPYFGQLPENKKTELTNHIVNLRDVLGRIDSFQVEGQPNPQELRDQLLAEIKNYYSALYPYILELEIYTLKTSGDRATLGNIADEARQIVREIKSEKSNLFQVSKSIKALATKVTISKYKGIFEAQAQKHVLLAKYWLTGLGLSTAGMIFLLYWVFNDLSNLISRSHLVGSDLIAVLVSKLFFLAIVIYLLQIVLRNYLANMHLATLNTHRENALAVFDAMIRSVKNENTEDRILEQLSKTIFETGETGYFPGKEVQKDGPDVVQFLGNIGKPK